MLDIVRRAFPLHTLDVRQAFDEWGTTYLDANEFIAYVQGRTWATVSPEFLIKHCDSLGFLGADALAELLPSFLWALCMEESEPSHMADSLITTLTKPVDEEGCRRFTLMVDKLTPQARHAAAEVLIYFIGKTAESGTRRRAREALKSFWEDYQDDRI